MSFNEKHCQPFFSIVTISYNQAKFLGDAIDSVLMQDFRDYEYIIQDPGSYDDSRTIIRSYGSNVIPLFQNDSGPADGLNRAFGIASGKFFIYINSDDSLLPNALKLMHDWIVADGFNHDIYSGGSRVINSSGDFLRAAYSDKMNLNRAAYGQSILLQPSSAISSAAFRRVRGFNPENKSNWDGELFIDLALKGYKFATSSSLFSNYRLHDTSLTCSGSMSAEHCRYSDRMYEKITGNPVASRSKLLTMRYSIERKIANPRDTYERILRGPIFKRL